MITINVSASPLQFIIVTLIILIIALRWGKK